MTRYLGVIPTVLRQVLRAPVRSGLTVAGIAVAMFLFTSVEAMRAGVAEATTVGVADTTLVVYRENRFCPFTSRLPQWYGDRIERLDGVTSVLPMRVLVSNCRASLDVVTFRGVPADDLARTIGDGGTITVGTIDDWTRRTDAALVGEALAARRGIRVGDRFSAAGITVFVAGILASDRAQDRNVAYVHLPFLQESISRGGSGGVVTQFSVTVADPAQLEPVADAIDELFARDEHPTSTWPEKAFTGRAVRDIVELVGFAGWVGRAALIAVLALVANAIVLAMRDRVRDHAVMRTLGWTGPLLAWMVLLEGAILGLLGGGLGAAAAAIAIGWGRFSMTMEGMNVEIANDPRIALIGTAIAIGLGLLAGTVPAIRAAGGTIAAGLRAA
jgi:putative ABC transport system permease protein